ncbi:hypothetical protein HW115_11610 [Verrucomicrobiaceae bacterium N1E253]|uniref:Uncharacterized protein n=1 Tax=Oceaniferula marina TaxID=2748318 RepID=A0A851GGC9_9BACT|nr:glycoside hydrolase family 75 protein [Oceaniferula marina]NWK56259.1 hypothetical protein [Oceaniferula marina]
MNQRHTIDGLKSGRSKAAGFPWMRVSFFIFACGFVIIGSGPLPEKIWRKLQGAKKPPLHQPAKPSPTADPVSPSPVAAPVEPDAAPPADSTVAPSGEQASVDGAQAPKAPSDHTVSSGGDIRRMSKGFKLHAKVTVEKGGLASKERTLDESYAAYYELKIKLPKPSTTLKELEKVSPKLASILPGLKEMLPKSEVSRFFYQAYENKTNRLKLKSTQLSELMTRHNFYDCETILNLKHPGTGKRVMLMQSEMDVVSDGSDGDRLPKMPDKIVNSSYYQPMTSYGWRKTGKTPNPLIEGWKGRIKKAKEEIAKKGTKKERSDWLKMRIKKIEREIEDMTYRSYLVAEYDPFIVMPINMVTYKGDKYGAKVGDYAVVIYKGKVYPCIVGDAGPSFKTGEASLRMAKQLNAKAGIYSRPVSDLTVTYLVFPGSADKFQEPDYAHWHKRCSELLKGVGGLGASYPLHTWKNTFPPLPKKPDEEKTEKQSKDEKASSEKGANQGQGDENENGGPSDKKKDDQPGSGNSAKSGDTEA